MTGAERDLVALVKAGLQSTSQVLRTFWEQVRGIVSGATLTRDGRRPLMSRIDRVLDRVYGTTQRVALTSDLFRQVIASTDLATELPFRRAIERLRGIVTKRDPALWERIRGMAVSGRDDPFMKALRAMSGSIQERTAFLRAGRLNPNSRWAESHGYRLSDRIWRNGVLVRRQIDATIRASIRRGDDVATLSKELGRFLNPDLENAAYAAHRLAQTEVTHAHGMATVASTRMMPGAVGLRWKLHSGHLHTDRCNDHASRDGYGLGPGGYPVNEVPAYPEHVLCKCRLESIVLGERETMDLVVARYGGTT